MLLQLFSLNTAHTQSIKHFQFLNLLWIQLIWWLLITFSMSWQIFTLRSEIIAALKQFLVWSETSFAVYLHFTALYFYFLNVFIFWFKYYFVVFEFMRALLLKNILVLILLNETVVLSCLLLILMENIIILADLLNWRLLVF